MNIDVNMEKKIVAIISVVWSLLSLVGGILLIRKYYPIGATSVFYSGTLNANGILWAVVAELVAIVLIYNFVKLVIQALAQDGKARQIIVYALPVFLVFAAGIIIKLSNTPDLLTYYKYDEKNIWDAAVTLNPNFFVYTSEIYIVSFFIVPVLFGPSIVKIVLNSLIIGYIVYQIKTCYSSKLAYIIYPMFLILRPVWEQGIKAHRMHWYAYIYLFWSAKLLFDSQKEEKHSYVEILGMCLITAFLTVLRREGLYLFLFGIVLLVLVYGKEAGVYVKKRIIAVCLFFVISQLLLYYPAARNGFGEKTVTYRAWIVHMLGVDSLDWSKIDDELAIVNQYLDVDMIKRYNAANGLEGYKEGYYEWADCEYYVLRNEPMVTENDFSNAVIAIIKKQPLAFIKSRMIAFYVASIGVFNNLYMPLFLTICVLVYSIIKKDWILIFLSLGVLCHVCITALTMPASYFKYFYEMYLYGYFMATVVGIRIAQEGKSSKNLDN